MNILKSIKESVQYLVDAATRWFSPNEDHYPETGVQPFQGDLPSKR